MEFWVTRDKDRDSLSHHGIPGQKKGVRRFQYENGSLTPEGKERYGSNSAPRSRKRTTESVSNPEAINKGASVSGPHWEVTREEKVGGNEGQKTGTFSPIPSEEDYQKKKKELDGKDWIDVYDASLGGEIHVKRGDFSNYIKGLIEKGVSPRLHEVTTANADSDPEVAAEMQERNALIRYWNEQVDALTIKKRTLDKTKVESHAKKAGEIGKEMAEKLKERLNSKKNFSGKSTM